MFKTVAIAGTFDRLHKGHEYFISQAFKCGEKVIIGLTSDKFVQKKFRIHPSADGSEFRIRTESDKNTSGVARRVYPVRNSPEVEEFVKRKRELTNFLKQKGLLERAEIIKIDDVYGPACRQAGLQRDNGIEALVVTSETMEGARLVNRRRKEKGLSFLKVVKVSLIPAEDKKRIASTRIRFGEIDRWGRVYEKFKVQSGRPLGKFKVKKGDRDKISERLRQELKKPQGILIKGDPDNHQQLATELKKIVDKLQPVMISTIGDEVTKLCNQVNIKPNLAIIDYHVMRQKKYHSLGDLGFPSKIDIKTPRGQPKDSPGVERSVKNPSGNITPTLFSAVKKSIKSYLSTGQQQIIKVIGEEDLAGLPAILLSPLGSVVIYGQPNEGLVVVSVTEEKKQQLLEMIQRYR